MISVTPLFIGQSHHKEETVSKFTVPKYYSILDMHWVSFAGQEYAKQGDFHVLHPVTLLSWNKETEQEEIK